MQEQRVGPRYFGADATAGALAHVIRAILRPLYRMNCDAEIELALVQSEIAL